MKAIALGVHVVDVLVRPVEQIPEGQGGALVEQIRITPAGSAGGTAVTLAKLGVEVRSAGAIGDDHGHGVALRLASSDRRLRGFHRQVGGQNLVGLARQGISGERVDWRELDAERAGSDWSVSTHQNGLEHKRRQEWSAISPLHGAAGSFNSGGAGSVA